MDLKCGGLGRPVAQLEFQRVCLRNVDGVNRELFGGGQGKNQGDPVLVGFRAADERESVLYTEVGWRCGGIRIAWFFIRFISNTGHVGGLIPGLLIGLFVREQFADRVSPSGPREWLIVTAGASAITVLALFEAVRYALKQLGGG